MVIEVDQLHRKFRDFVAVDDVSFVVPPGKIFGVLGPNGAGKTTIIKILTTILKPTSGRICINGFDPLCEPLQVRRNIGIVFQEPSLDDELTAWENLEYHGVLYQIPSRTRRDRIETLVKLVELWERRESLVKTFSGGMKRRLEIARALLHRPKVLFLDEPTLGLDPQTRNRIWGYVRHLAVTENITVCFTTHYLEEADRVSDELLVIDHGKVVACGSPSALKERCGKSSLEDAFLALTGHSLRSEGACAAEKLMMERGNWSGR